MSKTLPPKINLREGREEGGRKRERRGGRRRTGSSLSAGTEGERVSVSMELKLRNCEQERAPRWPRNDPCVFGGPGSIFLLLSGGSSHSGTVRAVVSDLLCRDASAGDEWIRPALPIGEHIPHFSSPGLRPVCVYGVDVCAQLRQTGGCFIFSVGFFFFFKEIWLLFFPGGCVIRGMERTQAGVQLFRCFRGTAPPQRIFGLHIKGKRDAQ